MLLFLFVEPVSVSLKFAGITHKVVEFLLIKQNELDTRKIKGVFNYYDKDKESAISEELVYQALRACDVACFDADIAKKLTI